MTKRKQQCNLNLTGTLKAVRDSIKKGLLDESRNKFRGDRGALTSFVEKQMDEQTQTCLLYTSPSPRDS